MFTQPRDPALSNRPATVTVLLSLGLTRMTFTADAPPLLTEN